jgi:regulatory protein
VTIAEAEEKIFKYCHYQPRSQEEVLRKLRSMPIIPDAVDELLVNCITNGWVKEADFAYQYVTGKFRQKGWGKNKIRNGLYAKGVREPILSESLATIDDEEYEASIRTIASKKAKNITGRNAWEKHQKLLRYLLQRGYALDEIQKALHAPEHD